MTKIKIGNKTIGEKEPLYFIADIAANHDGDIERAYKLIELAKESGADAAKFQNFQAAKIVSKEGFGKLGGKLSHQAAWKKSVFEIYEDASVPFDWTERLKKKCDEVGIEYFTSPYDYESIDHVDPFVNVYKIGSGDITWPEVIEYIARKGKPVILSTGASAMSDVERAIGILQSLTDRIVLMQCNTNYTAESENFKYINLNVLKTYSQRFPDVILGLSDHTRGHTTVLAAISLGARVFEKHFTDDNTREGPDHKFAMDPKAWRVMVDSAEEAYAALGDGIKRIEENEKETASVQRRAIRLNKDLESGHVISSDDVEFLRPIPADGINPYQLGEIIGKVLIMDLKKGDCLKFSNLK